MIIMSTYSKLGEQDELIIQIQGNFDFNQYEEFTDSYRKYDHVFKKYTVDLSEVKVIDSSGLGMFLLLRDFAGGDASEVCLINPNPIIRDTLEISKFKKLFSII